MSMPPDKARFLASGRSETAWYGVRGKRAQSRVMRPLVYIDGKPHTYEQLSAMTGLAVAVIAKRDQDARKLGVADRVAYITRPYRSRAPKPLR